MARYICISSKDIYDITVYQGASSSLSDQYYMRAFLDNHDQDVFH